jgi:protein-tyrosine phosphatase
MKNALSDAAARRILPAEGICNIRELGGYPVAGERGAARRVKWGLLYRSGSPSEMTERDRALLRERGVRTVVDFRALNEKPSPPDSLPETVRRRVALPINAGNLMAMVPTAQGAETEMRRLYRALPGEAAHDYQRFFALIARRENAPVLFHCSMGKDRTGLAAALILYALGADMDVIFADYLESAARIRAHMAAALDARPDTAPYMIVQRDYLESAFERIEELGGLDHYVRCLLGADIARLRAHYTE